MRPIDADEFGKVIETWIRMHWGEAFTGDDVGSDFLEMLDEEPTLDVKPVVHAHWIQAEDECGEGTNVYKCSACREIQFLKFGTPQWNEWNYCPNCGADMKEEKQDG